jgi:hypothetical protein
MVAPKAIKLQIISISEQCAPSARRPDEGLPGRTSRRRNEAIGDGSAAATDQILCVEVLARTSSNPGAAVHQRVFIAES